MKIKDYSKNNIKLLHFSKLFDDCATALIHCIDGDVELL